VNDRAIILAIETSNPAAAGGGCGVALSGVMGGGVVDEELLMPPLPGARGGNDDDLMPALDRLFRRCKVSPRDVRVVAVSVGPGGFTGLRVACAAGKMIAEAAGALCVAVPTAHVVARGMEGLVRERGPMIVTLAAKGETTWAQVFTPDEQFGRVGPIGPGGLITAAEIADLYRTGVRSLVGDRFLPISIRAEAERWGLVIVEPVLSARACLEVGRELSRIDPAELVPMYPREPEAVTLWRERHAAQK